MPTYQYIPQNLSFLARESIAVHKAFNLTCSGVAKQLNSVKLEPSPKAHSDKTQLFSAAMLLVCPVSGKCTFSE